MAVAAASLMENWLIDVVNRDRDRLTAAYIGHRAFIDGLGDRLLNLRLITAQEALAVYRALVFAVESAIDEIGHGIPPNYIVSRPGEPDPVRPVSLTGKLTDSYQDDLRTRKYHSHSRRTCLRV